MRRRIVWPAVALAATMLSVLVVRAGPSPVTLKTTEFGRGPTIVFLHEVAAGRMTWMSVARKLLAGHRVVMVDLPGHGESPLPDPFSAEACAEALGQVLAKYPPDSTVVVGHGLGGLIALYLVKAEPERLRGLVLIDAPTKIPFPIPEQQQTGFLRMLDTRYDESLKRIVTSAARDSAQRVELYALAQQVPPATVKAYLRMFMNADASGALKKMKPMFLYVASAERWPRDVDWPTLAKQLGFDDPGAIVARRVADSGALIMKDQPDTLAVVISEFTARAIASKK